MSIAWIKIIYTGPILALQENGLFAEHEFAQSKPILESKEPQSTIWPSSYILHKP